MDAISPMLAKAVAQVPEADSVDGGLSFEPKWDGFRGILYFDGSTVEIGSRGSKPLTRYFPELVAECEKQLSEPCILDGEIVVRSGVEGNERLDWDSLSQRIHPAASRIATLSQQTPASFVAFDLISLGSTSFLDAPFRERRAALERLPLSAPLHISQTTTDTKLARLWLDQFEGAGLDGVIAKPLSGTYTQGKRSLLKIKHHRTADVVAIGYRIHKSGSGLGSLLVGLFDENGELHSVGGVSAFSDARRLSLIDELAPIVLRDDSGAPLREVSDRNRFSTSKDTSFVPLEPTRVLEVRYDQMEKSRFRHTVQFERWRPDREASSCGFDQLEIPVAYDLSEVLR